MSRPVEAGPDSSWAAILDALGDLVLIHDGHEVLWVNEALRTDLGDDADLVGRRVEALLRDVDRDWTAPPGTTSYQTRVELRARGEPRCVAARVVPLEDGSTAVVLEEPRQAPGPVVTLAELSHEIRSPGVAIVGAADLLAETNLDAAQRELVDAVRTSASWQVCLLNDILARSEEQHRRGRAEDPTVDVRETLAQLERQFAVLAQGGGVRWHSVVADSVARRYAVDSVKLRQILANLASNAVKVTKKGHIRVSCFAPEPSRLRLEVADTGPGVDPALAPALFAPYQKGPADQGGYPSTGLGLSIARDLVQSMGGTLEVRANAAGGATFHFEIEARRAQQPMSEPTSEPTSESGDVPSARILLVEDQEVNRAVIRRMLESLGHVVVAVRTGVAAVDATLQGEFDLILMDRELPEMSGVEATARIRGGRAHAVPIVGLSADHSDAIRLECEVAGMDGYVCKPVGLQELRLAVQRYARGPHRVVTASAQDGTSVGNTLPNAVREPQI